MRSVVESAYGLFQDGLERFCIDLELSGQLAQDLALDRADSPGSLR
jgi:hypothetical protein